MTAEALTMTLPKLNEAIFQLNSNWSVRCRLQRRSNKTKTAWRILWKTDEQTFFQIMSGPFCIEHQFNWFNSRVHDSVDSSVEFELTIQNFFCLTQLSRFEITDEIKKLLNQGFYSHLPRVKGLKIEVLQERPVSFRVIFEELNSKSFPVMFVK